MKKTYLIKDQGKGLVENLTPDKLFDIASGGNGESSVINNQLIEVTYNELLNLKNTSSLVKGQNYLLTDYMTTYEQPVTGLMKSSDIVEPLILTAVSENQISNVCRSTLYPQDIVYYEITGDIGNYYGTEGFTKGKIYRRIDTLRNNDIGTDWRHVKYDRDGVDKLLFEDYNNCYNNVIKTYCLFNNVIGDSSFSNRIGDGFRNNTIGTYFFSNTIGDNFSSNTIGDNFYQNTIGRNFNSNTIGDNFSSNTIGDNFSSNTIGNSFFYNTIESLSANIIGDNFQYNTVGNSFNFNIIGDNFQYNTVGDSFGQNGTTLIPFISRNTEFRYYIGRVASSAEIQNQNIDVVVFKSPNGTLKQRYYDDSNNLVINNL